MTEPASPWALRPIAANPPGPRQIWRGGEALTCQQFLTALLDDQDFRTWFDRALDRAAPQAFTFETPAWTLTRLDEIFEFICVPSPALARAKVDPDSFSEHFEAAPPDTLALRFANLGGDAQLVVPTPGPVLESSAHLGAFLRRADGPRRHAVWQLLARTVFERLGQSPIWVSTAGLGVIWLHWRIGVRPKYYRYTPFKARP